VEITRVFTISFSNSSTTKSVSIPSLSYDIFIVELPSYDSFLGKKLAVIEIGVFGVFFNTYSPEDAVKFNKVLPVVMVKLSIF
jgi:hypothetical protein